jgi:uncharacterized membrane protein
MRNNEVRVIVITGVLIALTTVATYIGVPWPMAEGGYMHIGTLVMLIIALAFGKRYGALSGGIGMFLFDMFSRYTAWMFGTLVVRLIMGYVVGLIAYDRKNESQGTNLVLNIIAFVVGGIIFLVGSYFYEAIFLTTFEKAFTSIMGNVVQLSLGALALLIVPVIKRIDFDI